MGASVFSRLMQSLDAQDPTNVSFPFLRRMRRDHGVSMGLHLTAMPHVKSSFFFEADDARVAAFADNLVRPIYGTTMLMILRMLWAGYSPGVKNHAVVRPSWTYLEDGVRKKVWESTAVDALVYKPPIPLRPESCRLAYDSKGAWDGILWDENFVGRGGFYINGTIKPSIDLQHSLWAVHDFENEDGCQPPGEMVLTTDGYIAIEDLDESQHRAATYDRARQKVRVGYKHSQRHKGGEDLEEPGYAIETYCRRHTGDMLTIKTDYHTTRVTPNHKLTVKWSEKALGCWSTYLMRRGNDFRLGTTMVMGQKHKQTNSGVGSRLHRERGDAAWILGTFSSRREALYHEALWSNTFGVPDMCFVVGESVAGLQQDDVDMFWKNVDSSSGARRLLEYRHLCHEFPMYQGNTEGFRNRQSGLNNQWTIHAANLLPGLMVIPTWDNLDVEWKSFTITRENYDGPVYSLDVDKYHHYIVNGIITQNSPYGFPRIAHCAPIFYMYRYLWTLLARAFENSADPGPEVGFPEDEGQLAEGDVSNKETALMIARRARSGSGIVYPSTPYANYANDRTTSVPKWFINYPKRSTDFKAIQDFLSYLEALKFRALWLSEASVSEGQGGTSSKNVIESASSQRDTSQIVLMQQIIDNVFMRQIVLPGMAINMPWYEGRLEMKVLGFGQDDEDTVRQIFQLAGQKDLSSFGIDLRRLADSKGFPMIGDSEFLKEIDRRQQQAAQISDTSAPPAVEPTEGRRALVTQTGFSDGRAEMTYVQLNDPVELSSSADGDFVATLPQTPTWEDKVVVDAARALRSKSSEFLSWAYRDAAMSISRGSEPHLDEVEDLHLSRDDRISRAARRIVERWTPRQEKVASYSQAVRRSLGRAFDKTASLHLSQLSSKARVSQRDETAAQWIEERGAQLVKDVLQTTRDELALFMADRVREGRNTKEVADDIRSHFHSFPAARASTIARTEIARATNFATIQTGIAAGVKKAQLIDGTEDECAARNLKIIAIKDALKEDLNHPNCQLFVRLLPNAPDGLEIRRSRLDGEYLARYDGEAEVVLLSPDISKEDEAGFMAALGRCFAA